MEEQTDRLWGAGEANLYLYIDAGCKFTASPQYLFFLFMDF